MDKLSAPRKAPSSLSGSRLSIRGLAAELAEWLREGIVHPVDWERLDHAQRTSLMRTARKEDLLDSLVQQGLVTSYVATRLAAGKLFGLVLGNYRIRERLGSGSMGVVFKAEHLRLRQAVAIKVLPLPASTKQSSRHLLRFTAEIQALAQLRHPNVVRILDAGELESPDPDTPTLHYFVMDYVEGCDLDHRVRTDGPLAIGAACDYMAQIADALVEAHQRQLVHRDIKPANVLVTPDDRAMLLDFGLVRQFRHRMTEPGVALGTLDYIAPEQACDASSVDVRADLYSLGTTLFWCLTGRPPFASQGNVTEEFLRRRSQPPPSARLWRSEIPVELDQVLQRLMAPDPADRYAVPQAVVSVLMPFVRVRVRETMLLPPTAHPASPKPARDRSATPDGGIQLHQHRVLFVDDDDDLRAFSVRLLQREGLPTDDVADGEAAWSVVQDTPYDLVISDVVMPGSSGFDLCQRLRQQPPSPNLKIILTSGQAPGDELAAALNAGADDYLAKPFTPVQLLARVKSALRLKDAQDRSDVLTHNLLAINHQLEQNLTARDSDLVHTRNALVLALAELVTRRDLEATSTHLGRMKRYCSALAEEAASVPAYHTQIDPNFVAMLECCAPLKDIGKVGLPDHILLKAGRLTPDERIIMQSHTVIGAETLKKVARQHGAAIAFLRMAVDVARHHHERYDGKGYPDQLAGDTIPLAARLVAIADAYDALRSRRLHRPGLDHGAAVQVIVTGSPGQYDPALLQAFQRTAATFERIYQDAPN